jgi:hypothetical protein
MSAVGHGSTRVSSRTRDLADEALEARIERAHRGFARAAPCHQRIWWQTLVRLINRRSPEQIHRMERERALR